MPEPVPDPFASARAVAGAVGRLHADAQRSTGENGTLFVPDAPDDFYLETEVHFSQPEMDANLLVPASPPT